MDDKQADRQTDSMHAAREVARVRTKKKKKKRKRRNEYHCRLHARLWRRRQVNKLVKAKQLQTGSDGADHVVRSHSRVACKKLAGQLIAAML